MDQRTQRSLEQLHNGSFVYFNEKLTPQENQVHSRKEKKKTGRENILPDLKRALPKLGYNVCFPLKTDSMLSK